MTIVFLLILVLVVAVVQYRSCKQSFEQLEVSFSTDEKLVEPDEEFNIVLSFTNRSRGFVPFLRFRERIPVAINVHLNEQFIQDNGRGERIITGTTWLRPRQRLEKYIPVSVGTRGRYMLKEMTVYGGDFLGLKEQTFTYHGMKEVVVYPKAVSGGNIDKVFGGFLGELSVNRFLFEDPVLTLGYREYTGREPMKMISWSQSARTGDLMVKKYDYTLEPAVSVVLNTECGEENKKELTEACFSLARTVCEKLENEGIKHDFYMNAVTLGSISEGNYFSEGLGTGHYFAILESLGRAGTATRFSCEEMLEKATRSTGTSSHGIVFITPGDTPEAEQLAHRLSDRGGITMTVLTAKEVLGC